MNKQHLLTVVQATEMKREKKGDWRFTKIGEKFVDFNVKTQILKTENALNTYMGQSMVYKTHINTQCIGLLSFHDSEKKW
jgi:hypothetical protein